MIAELAERKLGRTSSSENDFLLWSLVLSISDSESEGARPRQAVGQRLVRALVRKVTFETYRKVRYRFENPKPY